MILNLLRSYYLSNTPIVTRNFFFTVYICDFLSGKPRALASKQLLWVKPNRLFDFPFPAANAKIIFALFKHLGIEKENL